MNFIKIITYFNNNAISHTSIINIINIALSYKQVQNFGTLTSTMCLRSWRRRVPTVVAQGAHYGSQPQDKKKRHIVMWCMRKGSRRGTRTKRHDKNWAWIRAPRRRQRRGGQRTSGGLTLSNLLVYFQFGTRVRMAFRPVFSLCCRAINSLILR